MTTRTQPIDTPTGLGYGEAKELEDAQRALPLPDNTPQQATSGAAPAQAGPVQRPDVFGPTQRENEPITAGASSGAGPDNLGLLPPDPVAHLRALYRMFPHDDLRRLLERASERS